MSPLKITLLQSTSFTIEACQSIQQFLSWVDPQISSEICNIDLTDKHTSAGWDVETLAHVTQQSVILRGALEHSVHKTLTPEQILSQCINTHTCVKAFLSPSSFQFFVVSSPQTISFSPISAFHSFDHASFHTAMELALAQKNTHCVHTINKDTCASLTAFYPKVRVTFLHSAEATSQIFKAPHIFQVIYTTPHTAEFIDHLMQNLYAERLATSLIEIGPKTAIFSFQNILDAGSVLLSLSLLLRYIGYVSLSESMEKALISNWISIKKYSLSWAMEKIKQWVEPKARDGKNTWNQLSRKYYDLSLQNLTVVGFDVLFMPHLSIHELGSSLEEFSAQYPFYLESIAHYCMQLYPLSSFLPHLDSSLYCRFYARDKTIHTKDIGLFIERISSVYSWLQVALLYESNGKKNFSPLISF